MMKLPLYLPYKPYEYTIDWVPGRLVKGTDGVKRWKKSHYRYNRVDNPDYKSDRKAPAYHTQSNIAREMNRNAWLSSYTGRNPELVADNRHDWVKGKKINNFVSKWWKRRKDQLLSVAYNRILGKRKYPLNKK